MVKNVSSELKTCRKTKKEKLTGCDIGKVEGRAKEIERDAEIKTKGYSCGK